ncbi:MAG: ATP-binding protein [Bacteroidales bacterium]|nr:ATP-binding protein [Bacteroidales bacterium]
MEEFKRSRVKNPTIFLTFTGLLVIFTLMINFMWSEADVSQSMTKSTIVLFLYLLNFLFINATALKFISLIPQVRRNPVLVLLGIILFFLVVRGVSIQYHIPKLLYATMFFSPSYATVDLHGNTLGELFADISLIIFLSTISLKYFTFPRRRFKVFKCRYLNGTILFLYYSFLLCSFYLITYVIGSIVLNGNFAINPDKLLFFDGFSFLLIFMFFALFYCFSLLMHKATRILFFFFKKKLIWMAIFAASSLLIVGLLSFLFFPRVFGLPSWLIICFLAVYITFLITAVIYNKNSFQFISVISNLILFSIITSIILSFYIDKKEAYNRKEFVSRLIFDKESFNQGDSTSRSLVNESYNDIYSASNPPTFGWICKSKKYINRAYINNYAKQTTFYSFAYFVNNHLLDQYGHYDYKLNAKDYLRQKAIQNPDLDYVVIRDYQHYIYPISDNEVIIISQKEDSKFRVVSAFSFFFIIYTFYYFIIFLLSRVFIKMKHRTYSLYNRLLWTSLAVLLFISLIVCLLSLHYYFKRADDDRREHVMDKMAAMQLSFIKHAGTFEDIMLDTNNLASVDDAIEHLANTFLVHVNVYDSLGNILFYSDKTTPKSHDPLPAPILAHFKQDYSYYFSETYDNNLSVFSIYKTLTDRRGRIIGYIDINDVKNRYAHEIYMSSLISKYLRLYSIIIFLSIFASWLIYYFVSKPMGYIRVALSNKGKRNNPINLKWSENDAIGKLIREHNRMVDELRINAELLAKSERETAWREMAQEVAHEIKNPLTPMKLKMQMLERAWRDQRDDFDTRIKNVCQLILDQIDVLSEVADTFSEFAVTQQSLNTMENLRDILQEEEKRIQNNLNTQFIFDYDKSKDYHASVDKKLFKLMLFYLIKNAEHNRREDGKLNVNIKLQHDTNDKFWLLTFASNDRGLDDADISTVFSVKFSEGNCGHSLCLPIVKNIVVGLCGEIEFTTEKDKGTEFRIRIPKL